MKLTVFVLSWFVFVASVSAEIYKDVDAEGGVTYSDQKTPASELVPTPSPNTVQMPKAQPEQKEPEAEDTANYSLLRITVPADEATIRSNQGILSVELSIEPELNLEEQHTILVLLDEEPVTTDPLSLTPKLTNIDRGSHTLRAQIRDSEDKLLISSDSVKFYMKRLSSQQPKPAGKPSGPTRPDGTSYTPGPQGGSFKPGPTTPPSSP